MKSKIFLITLLLLVMLPACAQPGRNIALKPCTPGGATEQCGKLTVYENRDARRRRKIHLNIRVIRAKPSEASKEAFFCSAAAQGKPPPLTKATSRSLAMWRGTATSCW